MADPLYPTVPDAPGVPAIHADPGQGSTPNSFTSDPIVITADKLPPPALPPWGVYDSNGDQVVTPDTFVGIDYAASYSLPTYPVEGGAFQTYNKVERPFDVPVMFAKGGALEDRQEFIADCELARASLDLYTIVTPEQTFASVNIENFGYSRVADKGANLIHAEFRFTQIRVTAKVTYTTTANPNGADAQSAGTIQTAAPTGTQASAAGGAS